MLENSATFIAIKKFASFFHLVDLLVQARRARFSSLAIEAITRQDLPRFKVKELSKSDIPAPIRSPVKSADLNSNAPKCLGLRS